MGGGETSCLFEGYSESASPLIESAKKGKRPEDTKGISSTIEGEGGGQLLNVKGEMSAYSGLKKAIFPSWTKGKTDREGI